MTTTKTTTACPLVPAENGLIELKPTPRLVAAMTAYFARKMAPHLARTDLNDDEAVAAQFERAGFTPSVIKAASPQARRMARARRNK